MTPPESAATTLDADGVWQQNVAPHDWKNPTPSGRYNLVVVGGGPAGLVAAAGAAGLGAKVALIEKRYLGGDCLNFGCVPSKALLAVAKQCTAPTCAAERQQAWQTAMQYVRDVRAQLSAHDSAARFKALGVDVFLGTATFQSASALLVKGSTLEFHRCLIATGARAQVPPIPGLADLPFLDNESIFSLESPPESLLILGAGPIGCELGQALARLGVRVTLLDHGSQLLPRGDPDASRVLEQALTKGGIKLMFNRRIERVKKDVEGVAVEVTHGTQKESLRASRVLIALGRAPNVEGLGLEAAGVRAGPDGIHVDDFLRTTSPRIYAAGDVCSAPRFTHIADEMARIALTNALFFGRRRVSRLVVPWVTYTEPEVAHVGLSHQEANARGAAVLTFTVAMQDLDRAVTDADTDGFARIYVDVRGKILGGSMVARRAGEAIGELCLAINAKLGMAQLAATVHPYPNQAEAWKRAADAWNRTRLTPLVARLLRRFLSLFAGHPKVPPALAPKTPTDPKESSP